MTGAAGLGRHIMKHQQRRHWRIDTRYRTIATTTALALAAAVALVSATRAQQVPAIQKATPGPALQVVAPAQTTRAALPAVGVSRQAAAEFGRMRAAAFGEANPALVDATEMTLAEARRRVYPDGEPIDGPVAGRSMVPDDARVWLVRMRGAFQAPHGPRPSNRRTTGWMYTIVEVETGQTIASGFRSNAMPLR
jgi:hypothetical protein